MNYMVPPERSDERLPVVSDDWNRNLAPSAGYPAFGASGFEFVQSRGRVVLLWLLDVALKHKLVIAAICLLSVTAGIIKTFVTPPVYEAATTVQIDQQAPRVLNPKQGGAVEDFSREPFFFQTQYEILKSRSLAERVAKRLDPSERTAMLRRPPSSLWGRFRHNLMGSRSASSEAPVLSADAIQAQQAMVTGTIMGGLSIQPVPMTRIVRVAFSSTTPAICRLTRI